MADILALKRLVVFHHDEFERAHRRAWRWRRYRDPARLIVLDRLADAAQQALTEAERRYSDAVDSFAGIRL